LTLLEATLSILFLQRFDEDHHLNPKTAFLHSQQELTIVIILAFLSRTTRLTEDKPQDVKNCKSLLPFCPPCG